MFRTTDWLPRPLNTLELFVDVLFCLFIIVSAMDSFIEVNCGLLPSGTTASLYLPSPIIANVGFDTTPPVASPWTLMLAFDADDSALDCAALPIATATPITPATANAPNPAAAIVPNATPHNDLLNNKFLIVANTALAADATKLAIYLINEATALSAPNATFFKATAKPSLAIVVLIVSKRALIVVAIQLIKLAIAAYISCPINKNADHILVNDAMKFFHIPNPAIVLNTASRALTVNNATAKLVMAPVTDPKTLNTDCSHPGKLSYPLRIVSNTFFIGFNTLSKLSNIEITLFNALVLENISHIGANALPRDCINSVNLVVVLENPL